MSTSISIPLDLQPMVKAYIEKNGNFSGLVCLLLRRYFSSGHDPMMADIVASDVQNQLATLQDGVVQLQAKIDALNSLKCEVVKHEEKQYHELSTLIDQQYDDRGEYADIRYWVRALGGKDAFARAMKTRCSLVATKGGVSVEVAKKAVLEKLPELEGYL